MRSRRRRFFAVVLLFAFAIGGERLLLGDLTDRKGPADWVVAHAATLPTTLDEISAYPQNYRRAIVQALPAETKSRLWREQLRRHLDTATLNSEQRQFVHEAIELLTPNVIENKDAPERAQLATLCARGKTLFSKEERAVFLSIGVVNTARMLSAHGAQGTFISLLQSVRGTSPVRSIRNWYSASASPQWSCECNQGSWCDCEEECISWPCANPGTDSCGCFSIWACNGLCAIKVCCN